MIAIELLHGRRYPAEPLNDWGENGPIFLVSWLHVTYLSEIRLGLDNGAGEGQIPCFEEFVCYDGIYYGDWNVMSAEEVTSDAAYFVRVVPYDPEKAVR